VRAPARDPYPQGQPIAVRANDPNETQIQYDLYRIPFSKGQGGAAEPIAGASANGMSNSFPKVSPDGRWIVYVQSRNGLLMRPDSQLYIVPVQGGAARRMRCNTSRMNSWHSFSPNGRWMVFSSKARSPYTQMYVTHIDKDGNDSPAILIANATAANRAVNLPEFVNVKAGGLLDIESPATEFYRLFDLAMDLSRKERYEAAIPAWKNALDLNPEDAKSHNNLGLAFARAGRLTEAIPEYETAVKLDPELVDAQINYGVALTSTGKLDEALGHFQKAAEAGPRSAQAHGNLGAALLERGRAEEAAAECQKALEIDPDYADAQGNLGLALMRTGRLDESLPHFEAAIAALPDSARLQLAYGRVLAEKGRFADAIPHFEAVAESGDPLALGALSSVYASAGRMEDALRAARQGLALATQRNDRDLIQAFQSSIALYEKAAEENSRNPGEAPARP
jgi:tetratricopeptide (TPR) repeat protein